MYVETSIIKAIAKVSSLGMSAPCLVGARASISFDFVIWAGDSGGPLFDSNNVQVGVVSYGIGCAQASEVSSRGKNLVSTAGGPDNFNFELLSSLGCLRWGGKVS